ncbi:helix-turn-helix domain-containing protein [Frigoriflavimonas asaccharolytica]
MDNNRLTFRKKPTQEIEEKKKTIPFYYDNSDMAKMLNVTPRTLQRWRSSGKLPYTSIGSKVYYNPEIIKKLMERNDYSED